MPGHLGKRRRVFGFAAIMLAALLTITFAAPARGQVPATTPHQFFGGAGAFGSPATVDGLLAADGSIVTAWNGDEVAVATAIIDGGIWGLEVSPVQADTVAFSIDGSNRLDAVAVTEGSLTEVTLTLSSGFDYAPPRRTVTLNQGWNLIAYTGGDVAAATLSAFLETVDVIAAWDPASQRFRAFVPTLPDAVDALKSVETGQGLWIRASEDASWPMSELQPSPAVSLVPGWNLVAWWRPDPSGAPGALADLGARLLGAYAFDAATGGFDVYSPTLPSVLNSLQALTPRQALWVRISDGPPLVWLQRHGGFSS